jgi:hypothetical protein
MSVIRQLGFPRAVSALAYAGACGSESHVYNLTFSRVPFLEQIRC